MNPVPTSGVHNVPRAVLVPDVVKGLTQEELRSGIELFLRGKRVDDLHVADKGLPAPTRGFSRALVTVLRTTTSRVSKFRPFSAAVEKLRSTLAFLPWCIFRVDERAFLHASLKLMAPTNGILDRVTSHSGTIVAAMENLPPVQALVVCISRYQCLRKK